MNTRKGRAKFKKCQILLESRCSSMIVMGGLVEKLRTEKDVMMQWHTKAGNITTTYEVIVDFTLPALRTTHVLFWKCHTYDSTKGRYYMILVRYLLT